MEMTLEERWKELAPAAAAVVANELDGLFLPFEIAGDAPTQWNENLRVKQYSTPTGVLFFRESAFRNYGFESEREFARAVSQGAVKASSPAGIISLGSARACEGRPLHVFLRIPRITSPLRFRCETIEEANEVQGHLAKYFPDAELSLARNEWELLFLNVPRIPILSRRLWSDIEVSRRNRLLFLILAGLLTAGLSLASVFWGWSTWISVVLLIIFLPVFFHLIPLLRPDDNERS